MLVFINYWIEKCTVKHWKKETPGFTVVVLEAQFFWGVTSSRLLCGYRFFLDYPVRPKHPPGTYLLMYMTFYPRWQDYFCRGGPPLFNSRPLLIQYYPNSSNYVTVVPSIRNLKRTIRQCPSISYHVADIPFEISIEQLHILLYEWDIDHFSVL